MKKLICIVLSVVLINASMPLCKAEASWFSDLCGSLFTFITSPIWVFCPENPTFRKNNPFRRKKWEEDINFQFPQEDPKDDYKLPSPTHIQPAPEEKENEQYPIVNAPSPTHIQPAPTPEEIEISTQTYKIISKIVIDFVNKNPEKFKGQDGRDGKDGTILMPTSNEWENDFYNADMQLKEIWEKSYAANLTRSIQATINNAEDVLADLDDTIENLKKEEHHSIENSNIENSNIENSITLAQYIEQRNIEKSKNFTKKSWGKIKSSVGIFAFLMLDGLSLSTTNIELKWIFFTTKVVACSIMGYYNVLVYYSSKR